MRGSFTVTLATPIAIANLYVELHVYFLFCEAYDCYSLGKELYNAENYNRAREWMLEALARLTSETSAGLFSANDNNTSPASALPQQPGIAFSAPGTATVALDGESTISFAVANDPLSTASENATMNQTRLRFTGRSTLPEWVGSERDFRTSILEYIAFSDYQVKDYIFYLKF